MNMSIPNCPVHGKPMRPGTKGGFFCATKMPNGEWCQQKASGAPAAQVSSTPVVEPQVLPKVRLAEAALAFAGAVYQGSGPVGANEALALAQTAYGWLTNPDDAEGLGF
jgi:hypothetical protein